MATTKEKQCLEKHEDIDGGWAWLVLVSSFLIHIMTYGMAWSTGVYNLVFLEEFGQPKSVTAWVGSMPTAVMYAIGPVSSILTNKFGCRPVIIAGGLISSIGLSISYFSPNLYYLMFTFGLLAGAGYGISYIPAITAVSYYFRNRLSLAAGIAASGVGVGNFLYPAIIRWLINKYSWQESLLILGAVTLHVCLFGAMVRPIERHEMREEEEIPFIDITPFKKKGYMMLCANNFLFCCGISALYIHITALASTVGISPNDSAYLLSGLGVANLLGRFGYGVLGQHPKANVFILYAISFALAGLSVCLLPLFTTFTGLMCVSAVFGLLSGCFGTLLVTILIKILGIHRFANGYGCLLLFEAAGQLVGGPLAGALFDLTQSYLLAFEIGGGLCVLSAILMVYPYIKDKTNPVIDEIEISTEKEKLAASMDGGIYFQNGSLPQLDRVKKTSPSLLDVLQNRSLQHINTVPSGSMSRLEVFPKGSIPNLDALILSKSIASLKSGSSVTSLHVNRSQC